MGANDTPHPAASSHPRTLDELQSLLASRSMTPGWIRREKPILWPEMRSEFVPAHWRYAEAREAMKAAGRLIGTDQAERRNFVMRNPIPGNDIATLRTLICAYQSILPGEKARSHRHASHALRVILESRGSYSIVDGDKHPMESGDVVLTPGWCWHGHGHDGAEQAYWFDGLDVPLTHLLEPMFFEEHPAGFEPVKRVTAHSPMRFAFSEIEKRLKAEQTIDLAAPQMPTITLKVHRWDKGWANRPFREAANTVYVVMRGSGRSNLGDTTFDWEFGDTLAAPAWSRIEHRAAEDSIVFSMSDEALMRWTKYYRREEL
jgi:gentisate 1,2-dioxygenase